MDKEIKKPLNILVIGLQLSVNKGGAAIAESLMALFSNTNGSYRWTLALPRGKQFAQEKQSALTLKIDAVENIDPRCFIPPWSFLTKNRIRRKNKFIQTLLHQDLVIDASGISFVGSPYRKWTDSLYDLMWGWISQKYNIPFIRWTQSYGPFTNSLITLAARYQFKKHETIYCRGKLSEKHIQTLYPIRIQTQICPDPAITLPFTPQKGSEILQHTLNIFDNHLLATISPSILVNHYCRMSKNNKLNYQNFLATAIKHLQSNGFQCLFIPHSHSQDPTISSDIELCHSINKNFLPNDLPVLTGDWSASDMKSIISTSRIHIGSRYHSLVASLSSHTPAIAIGWHDKYQELFDLYHMGNYAMNVFMPLQTSHLLKNIDFLISNHATIQDKLRAQQNQLHQDLLSQFSRFYDNITHLIS